MHKRKVVEWADSEQIHWISRIGSRDTITAQLASTSQREPLRSILKHPKPLTFMSQMDEDEKKRDMTPQPEDVLSNTSYLHWPVSQIVSSSEEGSTLSLKELTEAYSVLAFRLRTSLLGLDNVGNGSHCAERPSILQPIDTYAEELTNTLVRDLARVLTDPLPPSSTVAELATKGLPSPKGSPKKKGMSEEEVKKARDVCTVCHAVIKFLHVAFVIPSIFDAFTSMISSSLFLLAC